ncbi:hypothetical protein [Vibrio mangrovi]|uniref:hypothetical protein n=1 Tax=Vibrio mangrovi TaxID=474394 RepID=UPI000B3BB269|nr:hypothetical protein [Vibrio mangrovi]
MLFIGYIILYLFVLTQFYSIFVSGNLISVFPELMPSFVDDYLVKMSSILLFFVFLFFCFPKYWSVRPEPPVFHIGGTNLKTRVKISNLLRSVFQISLSSFFIGFFFVNFSLVLFSKLSGYEFTATTSRTVVAASIVLAVIYLSASYYYQHKNKHVWELRDDLLIRGNPVNTTIDLSNIEQVIIGRPERTLIDFCFLRKVFPRTSHVSSVKDGTLVLKIDDSKYLPLYLEHLNNGSQIVSAITDKLKHKIIDDYQFNQKERAILKPGCRNEVVVLTL